MRIIRSAAVACGLAVLGAHADYATKASTAHVEAWSESPFAKAASSEEEAAETAEDTSTEAPSSEGEATAAPAARTAAPGTLDTFNLPRRIRSQISYTVKRMLEFDENSDGLLAQDELPTRMQGVIAKGDLDTDNFLSKDELTRMAYDQIQKRDAKAEAEPHEKRK